MFTRLGSIEKILDGGSTDVQNLRRDQGPPPHTQAPNAHKAKQTLQLQCRGFICLIYKEKKNSCNSVVAADGRSC